MNNKSVSAVIDEIENSLRFLAEKGAGALTVRQRVLKLSKAGGNRGTDSVKPFPQSGPISASAVDAVSRPVEQTLYLEPGMPVQS